MRYGLLAILVLLIPQDASSAGIEPQIAEAVASHFAATPQHQRGDLVRRADLKGVLQRLQETGVPVDRFGPSDAISALAARIPADSSEIQKLNAGADGKQFLRKVAGIAGGYRGVEELASRPEGKRDLRKLSTSPGGEQMIAYMVGTPGGRRLMEMTPGGDRRQFQAPRIYTADDLLNALVLLSRQVAAADGR